MNKIIEKIKVKAQVKNALYLLVAHALILSAVLTKTAVTGSHPNKPDAIFEIPSHNTSLSLEKATFVIFWAILAEIIVSNIAIIATTKDVENTFLDISMKSQKSFISTHLKIFIIGENESPGFLSASNITFGKYQNFTKYQSQIHKTVSVITAGNLGNFFLKVNRNANPSENIIKAGIFVSLTCKIVFQIHRYTFSDWGRLNHKAELNCHAAMVIHTHTMNQCKAVAGINVMYLVILNA